MSDQVGTYWDKTAQVDVVGLNRMEKTLVLGECKWSPKPIGTDVIDKLVAKTEAVIPKQGKWRVYYTIFARGGWVATADEHLQRATSSLKGRNWTSVGGRLLDLEHVDVNLVEWT